MSDNEMPRDPWKGLKHMSPTAIGVSLVIGEISDDVAREWLRICRETIASAGVREIGT